MERSERPVKSYQDLIAWRKGISLVLEVYKATTDFPQHEIYGLSSQLRRAATSIPSNIAEGHGRATSGEFVQFLCHSRGSLCEVETQIIIARELGYVTAKQAHVLMARTDHLGRILQGLISSIQRRKSSRAH
ncbi:MAG TPA: four helix bundle protein [Terriglobales bacterium]|jgi:four helix bundle protein|nr:four helix bundle protein [Terriglobales bacterium]